MALGNQGQIGPYRGPTSGMLRLSSLQQGVVLFVKLLNCCRRRWWFWW